VTDADARRPAERAGTARRTTVAGAATPRAVVRRAAARGAAAASAVALLVAAAAGCEGEESRQIRGAFEDFIDFGMSNEERAKAPPAGAGARPHLNERSRRLVTKGAGAPRLEVVVDVRHDLTARQVEGALELELTRLLGEGRYRTVRLEARPAGLVAYGGLMGVATARREGRGEVTVEARAHVADARPPPTAEQYDALVDLDLAVATAGKSGATAAREAVRARRGASVVDGALAAGRARWPVR
jgi:hypothetical protein